MTKIILAGGGTGGSVAPLLAVADEIKKTKPETKFLFIGTRKGVPEKELVKNKNIPYQAIFSGKFRRYISLKNIIDPFLILIGFFQSFFIILKFKPKAIFSAGGFISVPLAWAAWLLRKPIFIHQQDIIPGLANKLIAPLAKKITISFDKSFKNFKKRKTILTGNPVRKEIFLGDKEKAIKQFNLDNNLPVLLIIGGGTGAQKINEMIAQIVPELVEFCQVIHLTGKGKKIEDKKLDFKNYQQYEFLSQEIPDLYQAADLIISRAGLGVLTELSVLKKPMICIPIPDSHQEFNAQYYADQEAVVLINQKILKPGKLLEKIKKTINSEKQLKDLSNNISKLAHPRAGEKIAKIILESIDK
ncbi:undecaprenyldiphospho-muramoylpentapeptide beta-N-acetylglucosaminyltransferase [Patescibacteria group bacterium]|nr:undecaprenyldiphospho-muramoylpentapeptide beta-N-acetylglucosaminyltransferase [Patescibacteria group bacterium]